MTLTAHQWATAVRPLLDNGIVEVPGWQRGDPRSGDTRWYFVGERYDRVLDDATDLDRLAFLAVVEDSLRAAGCDGSLGAGLCTWIGHSPGFSVAAHDRETAALRAAYEQWPELGEWPL
jgi:hypothetical protein